MSVTHDEAVCLRHREWSETSQTVILLTRRHGLINGIAKGSRRERAAFSGGFELLQVGELGFIPRPDKDLITLTEWDLTNPYLALRSRYAASALAMFAGELTMSLLAQGDPHPRVLDALLMLLDESTTAAAPMADCRPLSRFLAALLNDTGQFPDIGSAAGPAASVRMFDPAQARLVEGSHGSVQARDPFSPGEQHGVWPIRSETIDLLRAVGDGRETGQAEKGEPARWTRVARFLAAWVVYRSGRRPASLDTFLRITRFEGRSPAAGQDDPPVGRSLRHDRP
ncbi:MAG: DNA repair protein RecO [Phycisphaeraceae bacterium]|nr:MAG: DNA repair protein RecO [Phycisphaeraceae bacterium]